MRLDSKSPHPLPRRREPNHLGGRPLRWGLASRYGHCGRSSRPIAVAFHCPGKRWTGLHFGPGQGREQQGGQNREDGDHHQ